VLEELSISILLGSLLGLYFIFSIVFYLDNLFSITFVSIS
jgi:hypothetical protein